MTDPFHLITTWSSSLILLIMGFLLLAVGTPRNPEWKHLRYGCFCLSASYLILGACGLIESIFELTGETVRMKEQIVLGISFFQAMLFTGTSLVFVRPHILTKKLLMKQFSFIIPILTFFYATYFCWSAAYPIIYLMTVAGYFLQLIYYTLQFRKEYNAGIIELEQHYCEEYAERLLWIRPLFYLSLTIGVMALLYVIIPSNESYTEIFTISYTIYYVYVVFCFITYGRKGKYIEEPAISEIGKTEHTGMNLPNRVTEETLTETAAMSQQPIQKNEPATNVTPPIEKETRAERRLTQALEQWVKEERFLCQDVPIEETANELGTDVDSLHDYFLSHKGMLFRTWRVMLRIEKAKHLLETNPTIKISELQTQVGFSDKSYFFRRFKQVTGKTPNEYRDHLQNK